MSAKAFANQLGRYRKVGVDLGAFQLYLHGDKRHESLTMALFERIEQGQLTAVTSVITLAELLVEPYRANDEGLAKEYNFLLPTFPHLEVVEVTQQIADRAAQWRARHGLTLTTSLQAATALVEGADALITTDAALRSGLGEIDILFLEDYL